MLSLRDAASFEAAINSCSDDRLRAMLKERAEHYGSSDLLDLTHLVVVGPGDRVCDLGEEVGFCPLINPLDGVRFGSTEFQPYWDWLAWRPGWFEMIITVGNGGYAIVVLIQDVDGTDEALRSLCQTFGEPVQ